VIEPEMLKVLAEVECKSENREELTIAGPLDDLPAILRRESVYCALGRLSRALASFGGIDFNAFLQHASSWLGQGVPLYVSPSLYYLFISAACFTLRQATDADPSHRILKRRLAWLIGEWVSSDEECAKLPLVWQILVHLLSERGESSDMAVRLTAAIAFKNCVDVRPPLNVADGSYGRFPLITSYPTSNNHLRKCMSYSRGG
jgi:hypothetical protein